MGLVNVCLYFIHEKGVHINYNPTQLKITVFFSTFMLKMKFT